MDTAELLRFLRDANQRGYAAGGAAATHREPDGSTTIAYARARAGPRPSRAARLLVSPARAARGYAAWLCRTYQSEPAAGHEAMALGLSSIPPARARGFWSMLMEPLRLER
jgi:hypothetical protein